MSSAGDEYVAPGLPLPTQVEGRRLLTVAFDSAPVGIAVTTEDGEFVQVNAALAQLLGRPVGELLGRRLEDFAAPDLGPALSAGRRALLASGAARHVTDSQLRCAAAGGADEQVVSVSLTCARVPPAGGGGGYLVVYVQDVTEREAASAELTRRSLHDPLTGLANRVLLLDRLDQALARLRRQPGSVAVLFVDLDEFKAVNDTHGHDVGDQVLVAVGHRLQAVQRPGDTVCRLGGDEFVVLCEDTSQAQADSVARRIHAALAAPIRWTPAHPLPGATGREGATVLTASVGTAATSDPASTAQQLLHDADRQMYLAKRR